MIISFMLLTCFYVLMNPELRHNITKLSVVRPDECILFKTVLCGLSLEGRKT